MYVARLGDIKKAYKILIGGYEEESVLVHLE
jgi:hypothetical protein